MIEKYVFWTEQEDEILRELREQRQITKWSVISQIMKRQFDIKGRNGKKCRERYENHLNSSMKREEWTLQQEKRLMELHNLKGNKWVEISRQLQRTDNSVKNHYHSKLRKAFRKINKCITDHLRHDFRPFKDNLLSKIIQAAEEYYSQDVGAPSDKAKTALRLKNKILQQASLSEKQKFTLPEIQQIQSMSRQIFEFNKHYHKSKNSGSIQKPLSNRYKGKQIISLLQENANQAENQKANHRHIDAVQSEVQFSETPQRSSIVEQNLMLGLNHNEKIHIEFEKIDRNILNNVQALYFFNSFQACDFPYLQQNESVPIFSGKTSSFTYYKSSSSNSIQLTMDGENDPQMAEFCERIVNKCQQI